MTALGGKLSAITALLRNPRKVIRALSVIKGTRIYTVAVIGEVFAPILLSIDSPDKAQDISTLMEQHGIVERGFFEEMLDLLHEDGYVKYTEDGRVWLAKPLSNNMFEAAKPKISSIVLEAFEPFYEEAKQTFQDRLRGKPPSAFDAEELRALWTVAFKGGFYRLQRLEAFKFANIAKFLQRREPPVRVLDYGCGSGDGAIQLYQYLAKRGVTVNMEGCDPAEGLLEIARDDAIELPIHFFNLTKHAPKSGYYDAIFTSQVLHWSNTPIQLVGALKSYLKPDGLLFGVQSTKSPRLRHIDLFIRLMGSRGFPTTEEFHRWFDENDMILEHLPIIYSYKAKSKAPSVE